MSTRPNTIPQGLVRYFDRYDLFEKPRGGVAVVDTEPVANRIDKWYVPFTDGALAASEGDWQRAEHMMDCSAYEYYYRLVGRKKFVNDRNKAVKERAT